MPAQTGTVPVLWIAGPPGAGKSTVSWRLFTELSGPGPGPGVAFADTDQLSMCYPAPHDDPKRDRLRVRNAVALIGNYQAAGAQRLILNGVTAPDPELAGLTVCRLRVDPGEPAARIRRRGHGQQTPDEDDLAEATGPADVYVDTTGIPATEVAALIRERCRDWPGFSVLTPGGPAGPAAGATKAGGQALLLCGPTGVGKSTAGFQLYLRCLRAGRTAAYIDLDQIGFLRPAPAGDQGNHRLKASNLATLWRSYHAQGARHLVATGQGGSWPQPGDPLAGRPASYLDQVARRAIAQSQALDRAGLTAVRIDTGPHTPDQAAALIAAKVVTWRQS